MNNKDNKTIIKFYQNTLKEYPDGVKSYRYYCEEEQKKRFDELLKVAELKRDLNKSSILDVGCGRGDFYKYLTNRHIHVKYTGIDLVPEFISDAKKYYPKAEFIEKGFLRWKTNNRYDYVICSGILSTQVSNNKKYFQETVKKMLQLSNMGIAFNFLTIFGKKKFDTCYYHNSGEIVNWCYSLKTVKRLTFCAGYDPGDQFCDATILLLKKVNN